MSLYLKSYTKVLKRYDPDLFAGRTNMGMPAVFRKYKRFEPVVETEGFKLMNLRTEVQLVFALTDNWLMSGKPRDWGIDDVLDRVQRSDLQANEKLIEEMDAQNEEVDKIKKKDLRNQVENFWIDERRRFAKATDDILTHSLSKDEPRKRLKDRSIKNGNY